MIAEGKILGLKSRKGFIKGFCKIKIKTNTKELLADEWWF